MKSVFQTKFKTLHIQNLSIIGLIGKGEWKKVSGKNVSKTSSAKKCMPLLNGKKDVK